MKALFKTIQGFVRFNRGREEFIKGSFNFSKLILNIESALESGLVGEILVFSHKYQTSANKLKSLLLQRVSISLGGTVPTRLSLCLKLKPGGVSQR